MDDLKGQIFKVGELDVHQASTCLKVFINSGFHGKLWPQGRTECIFEYSSSTSHDKKLYRVRNGAQHAEKMLLDDLEIMVKTSELSDEEIKVFINYSPCDNCSKYLKDYLDNSKPVKITFVFAQLYDINRESCTQRGCNAPKCHEEKNPDTLKHLRAIKDHVQPFNEDEWNVLQALLLKYSFWPDISEREKEDNWLQQDWEKVKENPKVELHEEFEKKLKIKGASGRTPPSN